MGQIVVAVVIIVVDVIDAAAVVGFTVIAAVRGGWCVDCGGTENIHVTR